MSSTPVRLLLRAFAVLAAAPLARGADALPPPPDWVRPDATRRLVFEPSEDAGFAVLVRVPLEPGMDASSGLAAYARRQPVPARIVAAGKDHLSVLVRRRSLADRGPFALYYNPEKPLDSPGGRTVQDPRPILLDLRPNESHAVPNTWERILFMYEAVEPRPRVSHHADFGRMLPPGPLGRREERPHAIARMQTYLDCPAEGVYRFAVDSLDAAFVLVDGNVVAAWPGTHRPGAWHRGPALYLAAGPHRLEVFNAARQLPWIQVGWVPPGAQEVAALPVERLLCSTEAAQSRLERSDRTLHPDFTFRVDDGYGFRHSPDLFIPVHLRQKTADWMTSEMSFTWRIGDETLRGPSAVCYLRRPDRQPVVLEVRDDLGFVARVERNVDCRRLRIRRYGLTARIEALPAICYPADQVDPYLRVETDAPQGLAFEAAWTRERSDGREERAWRAIRSTGPPVHLAIGREPAGDLLGLRWELRHRGRVVLSGRVAFQTPPFHLLPVRVRGDALYAADGRRLVLLPARQGGRVRQARIAPSVVAGRITCLDDFLSRPDPAGAAGAASYDRILSRILDGPDRPIVSHVRPATASDFPDAYGPLLPFARAATAIDSQADLVILSFALDDLSDGLTPAVFERHAAALSDLVSRTLGRPVLWVTPPPWPGLAEDVRAYALAIRRVAEAREIPVADLYSAFSGQGKGIGRLFRGGTSALSPEGHEFAAQLIARALLGAAQEKP